MTMERVYGIDLGTTFSSIAIYRNGEPIVIANQEGSSTTPSVVWFKGADEVAVGSIAKEHEKVAPSEVVSCVKRFMGDDSWRFRAQGRDWRPQEVSALVLSKLKQDTQKVDGNPVVDVVITVPAYFGIRERTATKEAGQIAGLNVLYVVPEPTAAAIAYGIEQEQDQVVLVYDLGGGTFDATVVAKRGDSLDVVCTDGDHQLGGKDWDQRVVEYLVQEFVAKSGVDRDRVLADAETMQELTLAAEKCKINLSSLDRVTQRVVFDVGRVNVELTRDKFDELTADLLQRTLTLTDAVVEVAKSKGVQRIDKVLLVGGSSFMPQVEKRLSQWKAAHGMAASEIVRKNPNLIVAQGAAILGFKALVDTKLLESLQAQGVSEDDAPSPKTIEEVARELGVPGPVVEDMQRTKVRNVTSRSFGVQVVDAVTDEDRLCNLIQVDATVPCSYTQVFGTHKDNQGGATLVCMENRERTGPDDAIPIQPEWVETGRAQLTFERPLPKGSPVEITYELLEDGLLKLHARDLTTNREIRAEFQTRAIMTADELAEATRAHEKIRQL